MSAPLQVVFMGVAGTGKSEVGTRVAARLGMEYVEGDSFHPRSNVEKMSSGRPLTDADRRPWLETLAGVLADHRSAGVATVLGCSALRRAYRDILRGGSDVAFVHLSAPFEVLRQRMERRDHFMPASLLRSQFDTLEPLQDDELGTVLNVDAALDDVVERAMSAIGRW